MPNGAWALSVRFRIGPRSVSFRQACMNLTELIGIACGPQKLHLAVFNVP